MDIITHGDFCITSDDNNTHYISFRMPSLHKEIDFVEQFNKMIKSKQKNHIDQNRI